MIGLFTGIGGLDKRSFVESIAGAIRECGSPADVVHVGQEIIDLANESGFTVTTDTVLDLPAGALAGFRAAVFERVLARAERQSKDSYLLINSHACFRWKDFLTPAFDLSYLRGIDQIAIQKERGFRLFCVVDDVPVIWGRLESTSQWQGRLRLTEIATWQDEERFITATLALMLRRPFYVLARAEPRQNAIDLLTDSDIGRFYFSFPITSVPEDKRADWMEEVRDLRSRVRERFLVFDPLAVRDLEWLAGRTHSEVPVPNDERPLLERVLQFQTVGRDLQLIDQSLGVIVCLSEASAHSPGVQREIEHGHDTGKDVLVYLSGRVSPFLRYSAKEVFATKEELVAYLGEQYSPRKGCLDRE